MVGWRRRKKSGEETIRSTPNSDLPAILIKHLQLRLFPERKVHNGSAGVRGGEGGTMAILLFFDL